MNTFAPAQPDVSPIETSDSRLIPSLTPDSLFELLHVVSPNNPVTVKGVVQGVSLFPKHKPIKCYGWLVLGGSAVNFCVDAKTAPRNGEHCYIHGALKLKPGRKSSVDPTGNRSYDLTLYGSVVGFWMSRPLDDLVEPAEVVQRLRHRLPLAHCVRKLPPERIVILASTVAANDIRSQVVKADLRVSFVIVPYTTSAEVLEAVQRLTKSTPSGAIILARGSLGGEDLGDPRIGEVLVASDWPFYTAIGHAGSYSTLDQLADESFETPSALGLALASALEERDELDELRTSVEQLEVDLAESHAQLAKAKSATAHERLPQPPTAPAPLKSKSFLSPVQAAMVGAAVMVPCVLYLPPAVAWLGFLALLVGVSISLRR